MSHTLFMKAPALQHAARRSLRCASAHFYHSSTGPKMPANSASIQTLLRQTILRATAIAAQRTSFASSQVSHSTFTHERSRSPSPPPAYQVRSMTVLASTTQWTHFNSSVSNTHSSVRTFTSTPRIGWPAEGAPSPLNAHAQKEVEEAIEEIQELYGTAKDEFDLASEETEKNTTYAEEDRASAREELDKLLSFYQRVTEGENAAVGNEVKRRVGGRVRELKAALEAMEEAAIHHE